MSLISIVIPTYGNPMHLRACLEYIEKNNDFDKDEIECIVVDDGSKQKDEIEAIAKKFKQHYIRHPKNLGKGSALKTGFEYAQGDFIVFTDSDFPYTFDNFKMIIQKLKNNSLLVIGSRIEQESYYKNISKMRRLSSSVYILLNKWLYGFEMIDSQCGLKGFEAKTGKLLFSKSKIQKYSIDAEILYLAKKNNIPVEKIPVTIRFQGKSSLNLYIDGIIMIYDLLRIRYIHRN